MKITKENIHCCDVDENKIWESLVKFGSYGFNKSHAVAYSIIAYATARIWTYHKDETLQYCMNHDTKKRYDDAIAKCKQLGYKFVYPDIHNMAENEIKVQNKTVYLAAGAKKNYDSYVDFLFGETEDIYNLIYKGVCDKLTKDRIALVELVSSCLKVAKDKALYMEPEDQKFTTLTQILDGLVMAGGVVSYSRCDEGIKVIMKRARGKSSEIIFHNNNSAKCKLDICDFDKKHFGMVRDGILSEMPYINTTGIERTLDNLKRNLIERGKANKVYGAMRDKLNEYMKEYFSNPYRKTFEDLYVIVKEVKSFGPGSTRLKISFNDSEDIFYIPKYGCEECEKKAKRLSKNAFVKLKMVYSPFIRRATEEFVYDFDIVDLEEIKD